MAVDQLHRAIAQVALTAARRHGFALGGGNALIAHQIVDRPTEDVDLFTDQDGAVAAAASVVEKALREAGYLVDREEGIDDLADLFEGFDQEIAEFIVTSPDGHQIRLQLARIDRDGAQ